MITGMKSYLYAEMPWACLNIAFLYRLVYKNRRHTNTNRVQVGATKNNIKIPAENM